MKCFKCGNEIKETEKFCPYCGAENIESEDKKRNKEDIETRIKGKSGVWYQKVGNIGRKIKAFWMKCSKKKKGVIVIVAVLLIIGAFCNDSEIELTYDFEKDVESGLLYSTGDGRIADKDGNIISEYEYITVLDNGALSSYDSIMDGYVAGAGGKIVLSIPEEVDWSNKAVEAPVTYEEQICRDIIPIYEGADTTELNGRQMEDDGNYFDEVVTRAWFDENGDPIALSFPHNLKMAFGNKGWYGLDLKCYKPIDQLYTIDDVKRNMPVFKNNLVDDYSVSLLVKNIRKEQDEYGNIYYVGYEYWSDQSVVIHGNFSGILNGDNLLVFGVYTGLASDDTANFDAVYISVENERF